MELTRRLRAQRDLAAQFADSQSKASCWPLAHCCLNLGLFGPKRLQSSELVAAATTHKSLYNRPPRAPFLGYQTWICTGQRRAIGLSIAKCTFGRASASDSSRIGRFCRCKTTIETTRPKSHWNHWNRDWSLLLG